MEPMFFTGPEEFRIWLAEHHAGAGEVLVGFHKRGTGRPSLTWSEAVDEALCVGWIDGVRRGIDAERYSIRFTPRKPRSHWSAVNVRKVEALRADGRMTPAGDAAFALRDPERTAKASFERSEPARLEPDQEVRLRGDAAAWAFFEAQPPWYRRTAIHWVVSAKRPETRERRLATLIADSAAGRTIGPLTRPTGRS